MTACPVDGSIRIPAETGPGYVIWTCPWCRDISREEVDPIATALDEAMNGSRR